jgi:hypothetical protein
MLPSAQCWSKLLPVKALHGNTENRFRPSGPMKNWVYTFVGLALLGLMTGFCLAAMLLLIAGNSATSEAGGDHRKTTHIRLSIAQGTDG